jgi:hypothetical protein
MLGALARGVKDGAIGLSIKSFVNDRFAEFGEVTSCSVDTKAGKVMLEAQLRGERERVSAVIERYEIEREGEEAHIVLRNFSSSREWLTVALNRWLKDKRFKLPAAASKLL